VTVVQAPFLEGCFSLDAVDMPPMCVVPSSWEVEVCSTTGVSKWVRL
jgi:hypothetical protein